MLERGKFGIEYFPRREDDRPSRLGWIVGLIVVVALISLTCTLIGRWRNSRVEAAMMTPPSAPSPTPEHPNAPPAPAPETETVRPEAADLPLRPVKVRNLLMKLETAEQNRDVEMEVATIEQLRALPGSPVADLDDKLAQRLGQLNVHRLFQGRNPQWVIAVTVKPGESASRIAAQHGSTLASLAKLNNGKIDRVLAGQRLYVLDHPRFRLVVHRRSRTAELSLKGKFFKRYELAEPVKGVAGAYELTAKTRQFWNTLGIGFSPADRTEIDTLLPTGTSVLIAEL